MMQKGIQKAGDKYNSLEEFYVAWCKLIRGFSNLTPQQEQFLALILARRHKLSKVILDENLLTKNIFDTEFRDEVVKRLGLTTKQNVSNLLDAMKKKGVLDEDLKVTKNYIPNVDFDKDTFMITFIFKYVNE
jgi:hypothetical protein